MSFGTESKEEAEKLANAKGMVVDWGKENFMITRTYLSAFEYCPKLK